jgi:hypothetical protein
MSRRTWFRGCFVRESRALPSVCLSADMLVTGYLEYVWSFSPPAHEAEATVSGAAGLRQLMAFLFMGIIAFSSVRSLLKNFLTVCCVVAVHCKFDTQWASSTFRRCPIRDPHAF